MEENKKKIVVVGGGPGGYVAAIRAAQLGADVTLVERQHLGGTCLNVGCIPTKCLLHSAELAEDIRTQSQTLGIRVQGMEVDFPQVIAHKNAISKQLTSGVAGLLKLNKEQLRLRRRAVDASSGPEDVRQQEQLLDDVLAAVSTTADRYPGLRADEAYSRLFGTSDCCEQMLRTSRLLYNDAVTRLNRAVRTFPTSLTARLCGTAQRAHWEA